jgi:hypothetical protein
MLNYLGRHFKENVGKICFIYPLSLLLYNNQKKNFFLLKVLKKFIYENKLSLILKMEFVLGFTKNVFKWKALNRSFDI